MNQNQCAHIRLLDLPLILTLIIVLAGCSTYSTNNASRQSTPNETWSFTVIKNNLDINYGSRGFFPQYGALDLKSSYFRLNYGPTSGWGTSIILLPVFWSKESCPPTGLCQGAPIKASPNIDGSDLVLTITGTIGSLRVSSVMRLSPPAKGSVIAQVTTTVAGSVLLDRRLGEAFKPVMLSSMHISSKQWDTQLAYVDSHTFPLPASGWVIHPPVDAQSFGLQGGTSDWKTNAPTVEVMLDRSMQVTGWVTQSKNPNDDNVGFWSASDNILTSWSFKLTVTRA